MLDKQLMILYVSLFFVKLRENYSVKNRLGIITLNTYEV